MTADHSGYLSTVLLYVQLRNLSCLHFGSRGANDSMHLGILACDLDGTLTLEHDVPARTSEVLRRAKEHGLVIILVTGRIIHSFKEQMPFCEMSEAVVAEAGGGVFLPRTRSSVRPLGRLV